jgi:tellurite methyltransferase
MGVEYDNYYQQPDYFGAPYPALVAFYGELPRRGKLLDLGCGQGRDAIALARLGFEVTGLDHSAVGIEQLNAIARKENLPLEGLVGDIFELSTVNSYDFILLDSMFHFGKRERSQEIQLLKKIFQDAKPGAWITVCIQDTGEKVSILNSVITDSPGVKRVDQTSLIYEFVDEASDHRSSTPYQMITIEKKVMNE